jgi:hypothetical protein
MKCTSSLVALVLVAAGAAPVHAVSTHLQSPPRPAINPQPLPPRHGGTSPSDVINPQPLPPRRAVPDARGAIAPLPLAPRTVDPAAQGASPRAAVGASEKN